MDFSKLFNQFNSEDSLYILLFMLISFFFGLLVGYLLRSRKVVELRRELKNKKKEIENKLAEIAALKEELALKEADLKKAGFAVQEAEARAQRIEEEKGALHKQVFQLNQELEDLKSDKSAVSDASLETEDFNVSSRSLETGEVTAETFVVQEVDDNTKSRLRVLEERMDVLSQENEVLRKSLSNFSGTTLDDPIMEVPDLSEHATEKSFPSVHPMPDLPDAEVIDVEPEDIFTKEKSIWGNKIISDQQERDDLTQIDGIGTFLEKQLNNIGVFTYDEISTWGSDRIAEVTKAIGHFEGRIEKDDWVEQAAQLALKKQGNPDAFKKDDTSPLSKDPEDLTIIEGIGPKIEERLKEAGIFNWEQLAESEPEQLQKILKEAGKNYKKHDPTTWPAQAKLAHNGKWKQLIGYQDELMGGKESE